ncbi:MAG: histidine phosphatase family protein [Solirubrobacterales bacterium]
MPTILLVRHGETHSNRAKKIQGQTDSPLTLRGIEQARAYGETIRTLIAGTRGWRVMASPLGRCMQTAAILSEVAGLPYAVEPDPRLMEVRTGAWSGLSKSDLPGDIAAGTGLDAWYFRCPGGERWQDMADRLGKWLSERRDGEKIVAVSHGVAGKVMRGLYAGLDPVDALSGDSPQDAVFVLAGGRVERIACGS